MLSGCGNSETLLLAEIEAVRGGEAEVVNLEIAHYRRDSASADKARKHQYQDAESALLIVSFFDGFVRDIDR